MKKLVLIILSICLFAFTGCGATDSSNLPYEPSSEPPALHDGVFSSKYGTMTFYGDGKDVKLDLSEDFARMVNNTLPSGTSFGTYSFVSDLPPAGWTSVRYDTAHNLQLSVSADNDSYVSILNLGYPSDDGKTYSIYVDAVTEDKIPIVIDNNNSFQSVIFEKE